MFFSFCVSFRFSHNQIGYKRRHTFTPLDSIMDITSTIILVEKTAAVIDSNQEFLNSLYLEIAKYPQQSMLLLPILFRNR